MPVSGFEFGGFEQVFEQEIIDNYRKIWKIWTGLVKSRYAAFKYSPKLTRLLDQINGKPTGFIIGSGISTVSKPFWSMWDEHKDRLNKISENPKDIPGFVDLFESGAIKYHPDKGISAIPDLVQTGVAPLFLVFNYNCHIELCLSICGIGYRSISYNGPSRNEQFIVRTPKCTILKPHGTSRLTGLPTSIVWPEKKPRKNYSILDEFVELVGKMKIDQIVILAWSGNFDPHLKSYLLSLKNDLDVRFIHVDRYRTSFQENRTYNWRVVKKKDLIQYLDDGAKDFLIGMLKHKIKDKEPCTAVSDPLSKIQEFHTKYKHRIEELIVSE